MPSRHMPSLTPETFTPANTLTVLVAACDRVGLDPGDARLIRHQTAGVYLLANDPIVVKINPPGLPRARAEQTLALVRWLNVSGVPTITPASVPQPVTHAGCHVTFWQHLTQPVDRLINGGHLGSLLHRLHQLPPPPVELVRLDAPTAIRGAIGASRILSEEDREFLNGYADDLFDALNEVQFGLSEGLIHGDPQHRNTLWDQTTPVLADWDSAALGPREWDLVTVEVHCRRFGHSDLEYSAFAEAYGHDIRAWSGFSVVRDLRELRMITTNARKAHPYTDAPAEVHRRISALKNDDLNTTWSIL